MRSQGVVDRLTIKDTAFITSGVSYTGLVESGGPRNQPRAMVATSVAEVTMLLNAGRVPD